jgi:hypothetical protein
VYLLQAIIHHRKEHLVLYPSVDTIAPTGVLLVPDHTFLEGRELNKWNFTGVTHALGRMLDREAPQQHLKLLLVFPGISLRQVDYASLLHSMTTFSTGNQLSVNLVTYNLFATGPFESVSPINSHLSQERWLTISVMAREVFEHHETWQMAIRALGISPKLPIRGNPYANLVTLLESGYNRPELPIIDVMSYSEKGEYVHPYRKHGSTRAQ